MNETPGCYSRRCGGGEQWQEESVTATGEIHRRDAVLSLVSREEEKSIGNRVIVLFRRVLNLGLLDFVFSRPKNRFISPGFSNYLAGLLKPQRQQRRWFRRDVVLRYVDVVQQSLSREYAGLFLLLLQLLCSLVKHLLPPIQPPAFSIQPVLVYFSALNFLNASFHFKLTRRKQGIS